LNCTTLPGSWSSRVLLISSTMSFLGASIALSHSQS
jgi:hypothetical protein